jgi:pseudouridine kinase
MDHVMLCEEPHTCQFMTIYDEQGQIASAISDFGITNQITVDYLRQHQSIIVDADMLVLDMNLPDASIEYLLSEAEQYEIPVVVDPTSPARAARLRPFLNHIHLITPGRDEADAITTVDSPQEAAHQLVKMGVEIAIVTLGEDGIAYSDGSHYGHIPAIKTRLIDVIGAGDALTAGVIFGLLNDLPLDESIRLGTAAAAITLRCEESVSPNLTPDALYSSLVI